MLRTPNCCSIFLTTAFLFVLVQHSISFSTISSTFHPKTRIVPPVFMSASNVLGAHSTVPSWADLHEMVSKTPVGRALESETKLRQQGKGSAHVQNTLRLFNSDPKEEPAITLYRDHAGWCPYCVSSCSKEGFTWVFPSTNKIPVLSLSTECFLAKEPLNNPLTHDSYLYSKKQCFLLKRVPYRLRFHSCP